MNKALIIGISDYNGAALKSPLRDATGLAEVLEFNEDETRNFEIKLLVNTKRKTELLEEVKDFYQGDPEISLFYFSGHGAVTDTGAFLATPDYHQNDPGIKMDDIIKMAASSRAQNKIIILDCCFSGQMGETIFSPENSSQIYDGMTILTASRKNESSLEVDGKSVFTNLLIEALYGGAADVQGRITPGSIYAFIEQSLGEYQQRPIFKTSVSRFVTVRKTNPTLSHKEIRQITKIFHSQNDVYPLDPSHEFTNNPDIIHEVIEPYANERNVLVFKLLQKFVSSGLVIPVGEKHMYFAAMNSKACKLTPLGKHYWNLVSSKKI